jgi:acetyl esterase/lipase
VGSDEILRDDAVNFAAKAQAAGVDVSLTVGEGLFHCYPICAPLFPEARQAMDEIYAFMHVRLDVREGREAVSF